MFTEKKGRGCFVGIVASFVSTIWSGRGGRGAVNRPTAQRNPNGRISGEGEKEKGKQRKKQKKNNN